MSNTNSIKDSYQAIRNSNEDIFRISDKNMINSNQLSKVQLFFKQTNLMIWKNYLVFKRNPKQTFFQIFTPVFVCFILFFLQQILKHYNTAFINKNPEIQELKPLPKCLIPIDCITIGYGIIGDVDDKRIAMVNDLMSIVSEEVGLEINKDIKRVSLGKASDYINYLQSNMNRTQFGVLFCLSSFDYINSSIQIPCNFEFYNTTFNQYTILYNISSTPNGFLSGAALPLPVDLKLMKLKVSLDNAYLNFYSKRKNITITPKINIKIQSYPITANR